MIVYVNASGTAISVQPSPVYQGSSLSGALYFVAPFPTTNAVSVAFKLPNGDVTVAYPMTSITALPDVINALGTEYSVWEYLTDNADITAYEGDVVAQFAVAYNGKSITTSAITFSVQKGTFPVPASEPTANEWQTLINLYGNLSGRVTELEKNVTAKVLVDFEVNSKTGEGTKYYSDKTTATVQFPTSSVKPSSDGQSVINTLLFTEDSWVASESGDYELAFGSTQTGFTTSEFFIFLSRNGSETYEAGTETTASQRDGFISQPDSIFQGSDGSVLLTANVPFTGRLLLFSGKAKDGANVVGAEIVKITN